MDNNTPTIAFGDTLPSGVEPRFPYGLFAGSQLVNPAGTSPNETIQTTLPPLDNLGEEERKRDEIANYRLFAAVDNTAFGQTTKAGQFNVQSYIGMQSGTGVDKDAEGTYWNPGNWFNFSTSDRETIGEQELNRQTSAGSGVRGMFKEDNQDYNRSLINTAESSKEMFPFDATTSYEWAGKNLGGTFGSWANSVGELVNWVSTDKTDMDAFNVEAKLGAKANGWNSDVAYEATRNYLRDNPKIASYFNETGVDPHEFTRLTNNPFAWTFQMNRAVIASQSNKRLLDYEETTGFFGDKADKLFYGVKDPTMARDLLVTTLASFGFATLETGLAKLAATGAARSIGATAAVDATSKGVGKYLVRGISGGPLTGPIESLTYNAFKTVLPSVGHNGWATAGARAVAIASDAAVQGGIFAANAQKDAYNFEHLVLNFGEYAPEFKYDTAQIMDAAYEGGKMGLMFFGGMRLALGLRGDYKAVKAAPKGKKFGAFTNNLANSLDSFSVTPEGRTIFGNTLGGNRGILFGDLMDKGMRGLDNRNTAGVLVNGRQLYHNEGFTAEVVAKGGFNEDKARQIVPLWTKLTNIAKVPDALIDPELLAKSDLTYDSVIELLTTIGETQAQALKQRIAGGPTGLFTIFRPFDNFTGKIATRTEMEANLAPIKAELEAKHTELTELTRGREKTLSERAGLDITDLSENEYKATKEKLVADIEDLKERVAAKEKVTPEEAAKLDANNKRLAVIERELKEAGSAYGRLGLSSEDAAKRTALRGEIRRLEGQDLNTITATTKAGKKSQIASLRAKREELRGYQKAFQDIDDKANNVVDSRTLPEADRAANDLLNIEKRKEAAAEDLKTEAFRANFDSTLNPDRFKKLRDEARALREENKTDISDSKAKSIDRGLTDASDLLASEKQLSDLEKAYTEDVDFKTRSRALNLAVIEARKGLNDKNNLVILAMSENARRLESLEQDLKFSGPGFSEARVKEAIVRLRKEIASREGKFETVAEEKARLKALRKALRNGVKDLPKSEIAALKEAMRDVSGETSKTNIKAKIKDLIELMGGEEGVKEARRARVILDTMNNSLGFGSANTVAVIHHIMNTSGVLAEAEKAGLKLSDMEAKFTELVGRSINYGSPLEVYHAKAIINHMIGGNNADIVLGVLTEVQKITGYQSKNGAILSAARVKQVISEVFKTADKRTKAPTDSKSTVFYISDRNFGQSRSIQLSNSHIIRVEIDVDGNIKVEVQKGSLEFKDGKIGPVYPKFREAADFTKDNVIDMGTFKATWDLYSKAVGTILDQKDTQRVELLSTTLDTLANETKGMLLDAEITSVARIVEARAVMKNSSNTDVLAASKEIRELVSAQMAEAKAASKKGPYKEKHKTLLENLFTLVGLKEILVERASLEADPAIKTALQAEIKRLEDPNLSVGEGIRSYHEKPEVAKTKGKKKAQKEKSKATPDSKEELSTDLAGIDFGEGVPTKVGDAAAEEVTVPVTKPALFTTSGKPVLEPTPDNLKLVFGFNDQEAVVGSIIMKSLGVTVNRIGNSSIKLVGDFVSEGDSELARIFIRRSQKGVGALLAANKSGDLFTVSHEMGHYARFLFLDPLASVEERAKIGITDSMYDNMMNWLNAKKNAEGKYILTEEQEEKFANGFGIYIQKLLNGDGKASNTGIQFAFNKIGEHIGSLSDSFKSLGRTENTKGLVVSAEAEAVYSALMTKGADANITDIFHLGFKDVLSSMSVDEQHLFGQRILGKMKWEAYKAQMQKDTAVPATVTSKVVDAVVEGKAVPIVPARVAVTNADVATAKLAIAETPKEKVAATVDKVVSDVAVTRLEVKAAIASVVAPSLVKTVNDILEGKPAKADLSTQLKKYSNKMKGMKTPLDKLKYLHSRGMISKIGDDLVIDHADRVMVLVNVGTVQIPFYISTGDAGKASIAVGKWYPVFGIAKDGWIIKGSQKDMLTNYDSPKLTEIKKFLDENIGDIKPTIPVTKVGSTLAEAQKTFADHATKQETETGVRSYYGDKEAFNRSRATAEDVLSELNGVSTKDLARGDPKADTHRLSLLAKIEEEDKSDSSVEVIEDISTKVKKIAREKKPKTLKTVATATTVQKEADVQVEQAATKIVDNGVKQDEAGVTVVNEVKKVAPEKAKMVEIAIKKRVAPDLSFMGDKRSPTLDIAAAEYNKRLLISGFLSNIIKPEDAQAIVDFAELKKNPAYKLIEKRGESTPNRGVAETIIRVRELIELSSNDEQRRMYDPLGIEITERTRESIEAIGVDLGFKPKTFMMMIRATIAIEGAKTDHLQNLFSKQLETIKKRQALGKELSSPQRNILSTVIKLSDEDAESRELNIPSVSPVQIIWVETIMAQYDVLLRTTLNDDAINDLYVAMLTKTTIYDNIVKKLGKRYYDWSFVERDMRIVPARRNDVVYNVLKAALTNIQLDKQKATLGQRTVAGVTEIFQKEGSSQRKASDGTVIDILDTKKAPETEYELVMSVGGAKAAVRAGHIFASLFVYLKENGDEATVNFFTAKVKALESGNTTNYKSYIQKLYNLQQIKTEDGRSYTPEMIKTLEIKSEQLVTEWLEAVAAIEPDIARAVREIFPEIKKKSGKEPNITATFAQSVRSLVNQNQFVREAARNTSAAMDARVLMADIRKEFFKSSPKDQTLKSLLDAIKTTIGEQATDVTTLIDILSSASNKLLTKSEVEFDNKVRAAVFINQNRMVLDNEDTLPTVLHEIAHSVTTQFISNELSRVLNRSTLEIHDMSSRQYIESMEEAVSSRQLNPYVRDILETYLEYLEKTKMMSFVLGEGGELLDYLSVTELSKNHLKPELVHSLDYASFSRVARIEYNRDFYGSGRNLTTNDYSMIEAIEAGEDFVVMRFDNYLGDSLDVASFPNNSIRRDNVKAIGKYLEYQLKDAGLTDEDYVIKDIGNSVKVLARLSALKKSSRYSKLNAPGLPAKFGFTLLPSAEIKQKYGDVGHYANNTEGVLRSRSLPDGFNQKGLPYSMGDIDEFIAGSFGDEKLIAKLNSLTSSKAGSGTLLSGIYNAIRNIFGLEKNHEGFTLLHKLLSGVEGIVIDSRNRIVFKDEADLNVVQTVSFAQSVRKPRANQAILKANEFRQNLSTNKGRWYVLARKLQQAVSVEGVNNEEVAGIKVEMENLLASMSVQRKGLKALGLSEDYTPEDLAAADRLLKGLDALDPTSIKLGNEQASRIILNDILEIQDPEIKMEYIKAFRGLIDSKPELKPFLRALQKSSTDTTWLSKLADDLHIEDEEGAAADPTSLRKMSIEGRRAFLVNEFFPKLTETLGNKAGPQNILSKFFQVVPGGEFIARQFQSLSGGAVAYNDTANSPYIGLAFLAKYFDPNIDVRDGEISGSYDMPSVERAEAESKLILTSSGIPEIRAKIVASNLSTEQLNALNTLAWKNLTRPDEVPQDTPHRLLIVELITARNKFNASVAEYLRKHGNNARLEDSHLYGTSHRPSDYAHNNPAEFVKALTKHELNKFMGSNELNGSTLHAMGWIEIIRAEDDGGVELVIVRQSSPVARLFDEKEITKNDAKTPTKISWSKAKKKLIKADKEGMALLEETVLNRYHAALENVTDDYLPSWKEFYKNFSNPTVIFVSMRTAKDRILRLPEGESDNKSLLPLTYYANKASDYTEERLFTHDELIDNEELSKFYSSNILGLTIEETNTRLFQHIVTKDLTDLFGIKMSMDDLFQMIKLAETNYIRDIDTVDVKGRDSFFAGLDKLKKSWLHKTHRISGEISDYDKNFKFVLDNSHGFMMALGGVSAGIKTVASEIPRALLASDRNKSMLRQFIPNLYTMMKYTLGKTPGEKRLELLKMSSAIHWTRAVLEDTFTTTFETAASRNDYAGPVFGRQGWWRNLSERWSSLLAQNKAEKRFSDKVGNVGASVGWLAGGILRWSNEMVNVISMHNALKNFGDNVDNFRNLSDFLEKYRDRLDGATPNRKELNRLARLCGIAQEEALDLSRAGLLKKENINILHTALTQHKALTTTEGLPDSTKLLRWAETLEESAQAQARDAIFKFAGYIKTLARNTNTEPTLLDTRVTVDPVARMLRLYTQFGTSNSVQSIGRARRSGNVAMAKFLGGQLLMQMSGGLLLSYLLNGLDEEETSDEINNAPVAFFLSNIARMPVYGSYSWFYKALLAAAYGTYAHVNNQTVPKSVGKLDIPDLVSSPFQYRFDSVTKDIEKMPGLFARLFEGGTMSPYERKQAIDSLPFMENILLNGFLKNLQDPEEMEPLGLQRNISNEAIMPRRNNISSKAPRMLPSGSVGLSPLGVPPVGEQPTGMTPEPVRSFPKIAPPKKEVGGVSKELADALELL